MQRQDTAIGLLKLSVDPQQILLPGLQVLQGLHQVLVLAAERLEGNSQPDLLRTGLPQLE